MTEAPPVEATLTMQEMFNAAAKGYSDRLAESMRGQNGEVDLNAWEMKVQQDILQFSLHLLQELLIATGLIDEKQLTKLLIDGLILKTNNLPKAPNVRIASAVRNGFRPNGRGRN